MTRIDEEAFTLELPGDWEGIGGEPGTLVYHEIGGRGMVTVVPLSVRPLFAIADKMRLMSDYIDHRAKYETGQAPTLVHTEPVIEERDGAIEGLWDGVDTLFGRMQRHKTLLVDDVLVDFCFSAPSFDDESFGLQAAEVLGGASLATHGEES